MEFNIEKYHLKSSSLFEFLTKQELALVKSQLLRKEYAKGDVLFKEESFSKGIYILRKGKVKIFQTNYDGRQSIVYIYKKNDYFGYRPLLAGESNPVSAVAMDNIVVSFIPADVFMSILSKSPSLAKKLLITLSKEFSVWINKVTIFLHCHVKQRVALSLLILNQVYNRTENETQHSVITINRDDFAGFVGTAKETLVRMLRTFKDHKIITTKGTKIIILDRHALLSMVSEL